MKRLVFFIALFFSFSSFADVIHCQAQNKDIAVQINLSREHIILASFMYRLGDEIIMSSFIQTTMTEDPTTKTQSFKHDFKTTKGNKLFKKDTHLSFRIDQKRLNSELLKFELNPKHEARLVQILKDKELVVDNFDCN